MSKRIWQIPLDEKDLEPLAWEVCADVLGRLKSRGKLKFEGRDWDVTTSLFQTPGLDFHLSGTNLIAINMFDVDLRLSYFTFFSSW